MKIAVTAEGPQKNSAVDPRFGRARHFLVYDTETLAYAPHDNGQNLSAPQGAGIQAAGTVDNLGCKAVITGHCGPKAFAALSKAGITIYTGASGTVEEAVQSFLCGTLAKLPAADVEGHW
jgi:predicted Fe-Mo cluster-binding NifX family protein